MGQREELEEVAPEEMDDYVNLIRREYIRRAYLPENMKRSRKTVTR